MISLKKIILENMYNPKSLIGYYTDICNRENIKPLPIKFKPTGMAGAACVYNSKTFEPIEFNLDLSKLKDPEFAILHEIAHQIMLVNYKDPNHTSKFKNLFNKLNDKYMYSDLTFKWFK